MVDTLVARQRKTARYWFGKVSPLDRFRLADAGDTRELCFEDLMLLYDLETRPASVAYRARAYDRAGNEIGWQRSALGAKTVCVGPLPPARSGEDYVVIRVDRSRGRHVSAPVFVHMASDGEGIRRIIGPWRQ
jgi:hypothetical protein